MSSLRNCNDAYILAKGTIIVENKAAAGAANNAANKKVIFKNCAPFPNCISRIKYKQVDDSCDTDSVIPMYKLIEYSDDYSKIFGIL